MRSISFPILLLALTGRMWCQEAPVSLKIQEVMDQFGRSHHGVWIQAYSGVASDGDVHVLTLGHNGKEYKGFIQNLTKKDSLIVEGNYHFENIKLVLHDNNYELAGFMLGTAHVNGILVQVLDKRKEKGKYIEFVKLAREGFKILDCPAQVWFQSYTGVMDRNPVVIQLQKEKDQRVYGSISVPSKLTGYLVSGDCGDPLCETMDLKVHDFFGERFKDYKGKAAGPGKFQVDEWYKDKHFIHEIWQAGSKYFFKCRNSKLPGLHLYAQYPVLGERDFDNWMEDFINKWTEQVQSFYLPGPMQQQQQASLHMDLDWVSPEWVSGIMKFVEPWSEYVRSLPFTYDRKLNRIVSIEELFDKDFDYKAFFAEYVSWKKKEMMSINTSNRFKAYMELEFFSHWTLRPEGFCFTSEFNSVWGTRKIIIPYGLLQEHIRKTGPLKKLF